MGGGKILSRTICIFCPKFDYLLKIKKCLINKFDLIVVNTFNELINAINIENISCLIIYPFDSGSCILDSIKKIKIENVNLPIILIISDQCSSIKNCIKYFNYIEFNDLNKIHEIIDLIITQSQFVAQIESNVNSDHPARIKKALKFIHENFTEIKYTTHLAEFLGISSRTFQIDFKKYVQISFKQYLLKIKLKYAVYLRQNKELPIKEIANRCGYENEIEFYHLFKRKMKISLSKYFLEYRFADFDKIFNHE